MAKNKRKNAYSARGVQVMAEMSEAMDEMLMTNEEASAVGEAVSSVNLDFNDRERGANTQPKIIYNTLDKESECLSRDEAKQISERLKGIQACLKNTYRALLVRAHFRALNPKKLKKLKVSVEGEFEYKGQTVLRMAECQASIADLYVSLVQAIISLKQPQGCQYKCTAFNAQLSVKDNMLAAQKIEQKTPSRSHQIII